MLVLVLKDALQVHPNVTSADHFHRTNYYLEYVFKLFRMTIFLIIGSIKLKNSE